MPKRPTKKRNPIVAVISTLVAVVGVMVLWEMLPIKHRSVEMRKAMIQAAQTVGNRKANQIQEELLRTALKLGLPVTRNDIKVEIRRNRIRIRVTYTEKVRVLGKEHDWDFDLEIDRPLFSI